jgi:uncharacterized protein (DUF1015 family)
MDPSSPVSPRFTLSPFRAMRLADRYLGAPVANRVFARPYRSVPARLLDWRRQRNLRVDPEPALYLHEYTGTGVTIRGLVGLLDLVPAAGLVLPHEGVDPAHVGQLAGRMHQMSLNPAPILLMHRGPAEVRDRIRSFATTEPHLVITDRAGQRHRLWRVPEDEAGALVQGLAATRAVVADGHHRYAAAVQLASEHPDTGWDRTLVMLVDQADTPLQLGAIHRSVPGLRLDMVARVAEEHGDTFVPRVTRQEALERLTDGLVLHDGRRWATLSLHAGEPGMPIRDLHSGLLTAWGVEERRVAHHHTAAAALAAAGRGLAILLPAPTFDQVAESALSGRLLPQKATSFQPKPHLGVLMRDLRDG